MPEINLAWRPKGTELWPADASGISVAKVIELYKNNFTGVLMKPGAREKFEATCKRTGGYSKFEDAAHAFGLTDQFKGTLVIPFVWMMVFWPGCLPGAAQQRGDCVSHAKSGAERLTIAGDIASRLADSVTGLVEGVPLVDPKGIIDGVTSSEAGYWFRGHGSDGWDCNEAADISVNYGCMLRNNFPELGIDLRTYSGSLAGKYGSKRPPQPIITECQKHPIYTAASASTFDAIRDALGNLHGVQTCGGEGYSSTRNQYAYSPRSGSWSHGYKIIGTDDRPEIVKIFGEPLVLQDNNWGRWNTGNRDIFNSKQFVPALLALIKKVTGRTVDLVKLDIVNPQTGNIMVPPGSWFSRWSEVKNRSFYVYGGIKGWQRKKLPGFGGSLAG